MGGGGQWKEGQMTDDGGLGWEEKEKKRPATQELGRQEGRLV